MILGVKTIIDYDKGILEEADRTTPIYATCIGHTHGVPSVQELQGKNICCVQMLYYADWALDVANAIFTVGEA